MFVIRLVPGRDADKMQGWRSQAQGANISARTDNPGEGSKSQDRERQIRTSRRRGSGAARVSSRVASSSVVEMFLFSLSLPALAFLVFHLSANYGCRKSDKGQT